MDGLSAAASVIAVVQLTTEVTKYCIDAAGALEDRRLLREEVGACGNLLMDLYKLYANDIEGSEKGDDNDARNDTWANKINVLKSENAPLYRLTQTLDAIKTKLRPEKEKGFRKIKTVLKWPFDGKEVAKLIDAMQRERSLLQFALTHESTQLSKEIKETAGENSRRLAELIEHIKVKSTENDNQVAKLSRILTDLQLSNRNIMDRVEDLQVNQMSARQKEVLHWISPMDYAPQQSDIFSRRQPGTGEWLLGSDEYKSWLDTDRQVLFCPGIPGAGKTIMASIVIDSLLGSFHAKPDIGVAYTYCNFRRRNEQRVTDLVANILKQLCEGQPALIALAEDLYLRHNPSRKRPSLQELGRTLQAVAARYSRTYIVIDALDECETDEGTLMIFLQELHDLQKVASTNVFATSRFNTEIMEVFHHTVHLNIRASDHDVRTYLNDKMTRLPTFVQRKPELQEEIKTKILKSVQGMFLLAQLYLDSLIGKRSPKAIRTFLNNLPSDPNTSKAYDTAYNDAMERIEDQVADRTSLGKEALMWISCAKRVLSPLELQHALAIESESEEFDEENLSEIGDIISACAGLITVDEQSDTVRLVHFTTQEYFERTQAHWFPRAASELTAKTMTYLSFDLSPDSSSLNFGQPHLDLENASDIQGNDDTSNYDTSNYDNGLGAVFQRYPFCEYASWYWGDHARDVPEMLDTVEGFLASAKFVNNAELMRQDEKFNISDLKTTGLHEAAFFGLEGAIEWMLQRHPVDSVNSSGMSALEIACEDGHLSAVKLLLKNGASFRGIPMTRAAYAGHHTIVACLFQHGSPLESDALMAALETQNAEPLVRVLLDHGADVNLCDSNGYTPLISAIIRSNEPLAQLLLDRGADVNLPDKYGDLPLHTAIGYDAESLARLLFDYGADINLPNSVGFSPLHCAVYNNSESLSRLLLEYGADVELPNANGNTALRIAVLAEFEDNHLATLLLEHGAKATVENKYGITLFTFVAYKYLLLLIGPAIDCYHIVYVDFLGTRMPMPNWQYCFSLTP
ncbi:hypothetical protein NW762_014517 [Fusarium torreyae]|uniref:NACHT domain-containing protein n=1 Tax=Fusarium torreyae TaxID=1237075 RepID=A0A9W8V9B8_9HYPO|nr:hypothetical protein NW762_014517 [Fusarium torreyae]